MGQLCAAPWVSRSRPAATETGLEPRISSGTASTVINALDHGTTREAIHVIYDMFIPQSLVFTMLLLVCWLPTF